jgi:hypothetical protein
MKSRGCPNSSGVSLRPDDHEEDGGKQEEERPTPPPQHHKQGVRTEEANWTSFAKQALGPADGDLRMR